MSVKISRNDVIRDNRALLEKVVSGLMPGDSPQLVGQRTGSRVMVSPNNRDVRSVTVVFTLDAVMAVTKGATIDDIRELINTATNGAFSALGTGLAGAMVAGSNIGGATVDTLTEIMNTVQDQNDINIQVQMTDIDVDNAPTKITVTGTVEGWTVTTDWDDDEIANLNYNTRVLNRPGNTVPTENVGTQSQIEINSNASIATDDVFSPTVLGQLNLGWNLKTDGATTHDTISVVQISTITLVFEEEPSGAGVGDPPGGPVVDPPGGGAEPPGGGAESPGGSAESPGGGVKPPGEEE